jgi:pimeloyl-ACP methyl ester carboxylesterase
MNTRSKKISTCAIRCLSNAIATMPNELRRSLTWNQGKENAHHRVPMNVLEGGQDSVAGPSGEEDDRDRFTGREHRLLSGVAHNVPEEAPKAVTDTVTSLLA